MNLLELILFIILFISHSVFLLIVIYNYSSTLYLNNASQKNDSNDFISILIPARNEEKNIAALLESILQQSFANYEVIVLDDNSTDNTHSIVSQYSHNDQRVKIIRGKELPSGWIGKNWACFQLSQHAKGEYLLFIDSDVTLSDSVIMNSLNELKKKEVSVLSIFPTQIIAGVGAWLITPLMNWLLLNFLPVKFVYKMKSKKFSAANGQFILIEKNVYNKVGTHEAVKDKVVEDMEIARRLKSQGFKIITFLGGNSVYCKMYNSFSEAFNGFSKNFYRGFNLPKPAFILLIIFLLILFLLPFYLLIFNILFTVIVIMIFIERIFISIISKQNWFVNVVLHPLQMIVMIAVGINSVTSPKIKWKGRPI